MLLRLQHATRARVRRAGSCAEHAEGAVCVRACALLAGQRCHFGGGPLRRTRVLPRVALAPTRVTRAYIWMNLPGCTDWCAARCQVEACTKRVHGGDAWLLTPAITITALDTRGHTDGHMSYTAAATGQTGRSGSGPGGRVDCLPTSRVLGRRKRHVCQ